MWDPNLSVSRLGEPRVPDLQPCDSIPRYLKPKKRFRVERRRLDSGRFFRSAMKRGYSGHGTSFVKVFCAGDLNFALDESGLYRCDWQCPASYLPDAWPDGV